MERYVATVVLVFLVSACHATTAYNADHTRSWTCVQNPKVKEQPLPGEKPLAIREEKETATVAGK